MSTLYHLVEGLRNRNLIGSPDLERAFFTAKVRMFLVMPYDLFAFEDVPLPFYASGGRVEVIPSPRLTSVLLQLLGVERGCDVLVIGAAGGYLAALAYELTPGHRVTIVERDPDLADAIQDSLSMSGYGSVVEVTRTLPKGEWSRILHLKPLMRAPMPLKRRLKDMGVLLHPRRTTDGYEFVKVLRSGDDFVEITIRGPAAGDDIPASPSLNLSSLMSLEELLTNVWMEQPRTPTDMHFWELTESTFEGGPWDIERMRPEIARRFRLAKKAFQLAYIFQMVGELDNAESLYTKSLELFPTAEAHTFLGWTYSFMDRLEEAIEECRRAIEVDPTFGNPYNDIGAYLIQMEQLDEAIPWLKKALTAQRYCCYFYAHCNLGRVYMMKGDLKAAKREFERALQVNPEYDLARELLEEVERLLRSSNP
jgi:protein-L-isoaspartate O-methyltransferase